MLQMTVVKKLIDTVVIKELSNYILYYVYIKINQIYIIYQISPLALFDRRLETPSELIFHINIYIKIVRDYAIIAR